jgi:hypothetical protein
VEKASATFPSRVHPKLVESVHWLSIVVDSGEVSDRLEKSLLGPSVNAVDAAAK